MIHYMNYAEGLPYDVIKQWEKAIDQPWVLQAALMADAHLGYTMPIGGVAMTQGFVVPSWVGYDIGCGVSTIKIDVPAKDVALKSSAIMDEIYRCVPVGKNHNNRRMPNDYDRSLAFTPVAGGKIWEAKGGSKQMGTLGGGNHFIEIGQCDETGDVYLTVHSGSRGIGHGIATYYIKMAHPEKKAKEGTYPLAVTTDLGKDYLRDQLACLQFARDNRMMIMERTITAIARVLGVIIPVVPDTMINKTHNHVKINGDYYIHRKGATAAAEGEYGVIPGNMRDGVYIVKGKGCMNSVLSASHGAGREYSRKKAKEELSLEKFQADMAGIMCNATKNRLDESPDAYKDFGRVMELQKDLVEIVTHVTPIINVKG